MTDTTQIRDVAPTFGAAPSPLEQARRSRAAGVWFVAEHFLRNAKAYAWSIVVYSVGQPLLYLIALGLGLGTLVDANAGTVDGVNYLQFVAPALLISTVVMSVAGELTFPVMAGFKWERLYYGPGATSLQPWQIGWGHFLMVMVRFLAQSTVFYVVMVGFQAAPSSWSWLCIPIGVLTAAACGAPLQAYATTLTGEGMEFQFIQRFVVMPMFLFAGTFYPLDVMPIWLQWIGWISPIWHGTQLARIAAYGASEPLWLIAIHLGLLISLVIGGLAWSACGYTRRLHS